MRPAIEAVFRRREAALAALVYAVLACLTFLRLLPHFQTDVITVSFYDFGPNLWLQWWGPHALGHGANPFITRGMFYPLGSDLTVDAWLVSWLLVWPFKGMLDPIGRYNLLAAFSYAATGVSSYALFRLFARSRAASFLASFAFTFSAYRNYSFLVSHAELLQTQWCVLMILAYVVYWRGGRRRAILPWLLAATGLAAYNEVRTFLMALMFLGLYTVGELWWAEREDAGETARAVRGLGVFCVAALLLVMPLVLRDVKVIGIYAHGAARYPAAFRVGWRDFLLPPCHHVLHVFDAGAQPPFWRESNEGYVNGVLLLLALLGLASRGNSRERRPLAFALAIFIFLETARWPLARLPVLGFLHVPARFSFISGLVLCLFAGLGWERVAARIRSDRLRWLAWSFLSAMVIMETNPVFWNPVRVWPEDRALDALKTAGGGGPSSTSRSCYVPGWAHGA